MTRCGRGMSHTMAMTASSVSEAVKRLSKPYLSTWSVRTLARESTGTSISTRVPRLVPLFSKRVPKGTPFNPYKKVPKGTQGYTDGPCPRAGVHVHLVARHTLAALAALEHERAGVARRGHGHAVAVEAVGLGSFICLYFCFKSITTKTKR